MGIPGFEYKDLYDAARLSELLDVFYASVEQHDAQLHSEFLAYRECQGEGMQAQAISDLLVRMGPYVGQFVAKLFDVTDAHAAQASRIKDDMETIFTFKNEVVSKLAVLYHAENIADWDQASIKQNFELLIAAAFPEANADQDAEHRVARVGAPIGLLSSHYKLIAKGKDSQYTAADQDAQRLKDKLLAHEQAAAQLHSIINAPDLAGFVDGLMDVVQRWSHLAVNTDPAVVKWFSFKTPAKRDFDNLVAHEIVQRGEYSTWMGAEDHRRRRDGFKLTDPRFNARQVLNEVDHCIYCHDRDTDSCSKGMRNKKTNTFKEDPLGVTITGCPLEEKISEMHLVKRSGDNIGALAIVIIDNPMCPGTGHRICNECMKGCIYQKTEPVNIPQIETNVLTDVLFMPYGFEIYSLLTRWNPLNVKRPCMLPYNGKNALVVGLGPAGYTMSHYLLNEGFAVAGIDGLKLEPLPLALTGDSEHLPEPIADFREIYEELDQRTLAGFGGVAEYGITVRWDKNFLKVIYLR